MSIPNQYQKHCKSIIRIHLLALCILCIILSSCSSEAKRNDYVADCIVDDGAFLPQGAVFNRIKNNYQFMYGQLKNVSETDIDISFETEDGDFRFFFFEKSLFCDIVWKNLEKGFTKEDIAVFVQCFQTDKKYGEILEFMEKQCSSLPNNEYAIPSFWAVDNTLFFISGGQDDSGNYEVYLKVPSDCINFVKNDPKTILKYMADLNEWRKVENMFDSDARYLVDYYRNHETDGIGDFISLCEAAGFDLGSVSSDWDPSSTSTPDAQNTSDLQYCEQCGRPASRHLRRPSGAVEWYCEDHWQWIVETLD